MAGLINIKKTLQRLQFHSPAFHVPHDQACECDICCDLDLIEKALREIEVLAPNVEPDIMLTRIRTTIAILTSKPDADVIIRKSAELTVLVEHLDKWLSQGGALPTAWASKE